MNSHQDGRHYVDFVAQLASSGRLIEAELVIRQASDFLSRNEILEANFYFVAAALRIDDWARALPLIIANRRRLNEALSDRGLMFAWLSLALARFASGRLRQACLAAKNAWEVSHRCQFVVGQCLAGEILGPALVMTGQITQGFLILDQTIVMANDLGRAASIEYLTIQRELLRARYVDHPNAAKRRLQKIFKQTNNITNRASILLECCRLETITSHTSTARAYWRDTAELLKNSAPRRIIAALRSRLALICLAAGDHHEAVVFASTALQILDPRRDLIPRLELLEIIVTANRALQIPDKSSSFEEERRRSQTITGYRAPPRAAEVITEISRRSDLNHRQVQLLSDLTKGEYIDIRRYVSKHSVSEVTAFRDLSMLVRMGHLTRTGKARATRYSRIH